MQRQEGYLWSQITVTPANFFLKFWFSRLHLLFLHSDYSFFIFSEKILKNIKVRRFEIFKWSGHNSGILNGLLCYFGDISNSPHPLRLTKIPRVFSELKSNFLFSIKYTTHFDIKKKKKRKNKPCTFLKMRLSKFIKILKFSSAEKFLQLFFY